jgi:hypothetical protein
MLKLQYLQHWRWNFNEDTALLNSCPVSGMRAKLRIQAGNVFIPKWNLGLASDILREAVRRITARLWVRLCSYLTCLTTVISVHQIEDHDMKTCGGVEMSGQIHAPTGFTPGVYWIGGWEGPEQSGLLGEENVSCLCWESNPLIRR